MKLKLDLNDLTNEFFENTRLIGVMAPVKHYQFCWVVNSLLGFDFRINNDIEIQLIKKQRNYYFGIAEHASESHALGHYIYSNKFDGEYLLPEYKHLDFLWLMKGEAVPEEYFTALVQEVRNLHSVQLVAELAHESIKNKNHLIF